MHRIPKSRPSVHSLNFTLNGMCETGWPVFVQIILDLAVVLVRNWPLWCKTNLYFFHFMPSIRFLHAVRKTMWSTKICGIKFTDYFVSIKFNLVEKKNCIKHLPCGQLIFSQNLNLETYPKLMIAFEFWNWSVICEGVFRKCRHWNIIQWKPDNRLIG